MFNKRENWNYNGIWPESEYYQPQHMKPADRERFLAWYEEQRSKTFNFQRELVEYCESDVDILRRCCWKFRAMFMEIGGLDPFASAITIASACNQYFRMHHLQPDKIGIIPYGGYRRNEKQSILALKWLKYLAEKEGLYIRHKLNGGEVKIDQYRVDGICCETIYEFHGCAYHGCPR